MGRKTLDEKDRRKQRSLYLTESEWRACQSWLANYRGSKATHYPGKVYPYEKSPSEVPLPTPTQKPSLGVEKGPRPTKGTFESPAAYNVRLRAWEEAGE